jgi:hypothetical protein
LTSLASPAWLFGEVMVPQVHVVSILMIVNGSLASLMGILLSVLGPAMFAMISMEQRGRPMPGDEQMLLGIISGVYLILGLLVLTAGVLNIVAGARSLKLRGRGLALTALFLNIIPLFTCYCLPTSLGLMIYGLIVFFNHEVARAFELVADGVPVEEVRERFSGRRWRHEHAEEEEEEDYER